MLHVLKGNLCGRLCPDCDEPLGGVKVLLYEVEADKEVLKKIEAPEKQTFSLVSEEVAASLADRLVAEAITGDDGSFRAQLPKSYGGGPLRIDARLNTVPGDPDDAERHEVQFTITTLQPRWRRTEEGLVMGWSYCIPHRLWCAIRALFNAWVICGTIVTCKGGAPVPGAKVSAFDADWLQDDLLGSAVTDESGQFRIDYTTADFRLAPLSPLINLELVGGPDVYFTAELGGSTILAEDRSIGRTPARENVGPCFCVELCTEDIAPSPPEELPHWQQVEIFDIDPKAPDPTSDSTVKASPDPIGRSSAGRLGCTATCR